MNVLVLVFQFMFFWILIVLPQIKNCLPKLFLILIILIDHNTNTDLATSVAQVATLK